MRILFYSWAPYKDTFNRGGGVTVYLNNIIDTLQQGGSAEITTLSSGLEYSPFSGKPFYRKATSENGVQRFYIVNSPIPAPAYLNFENVENAVTDTSTRDVLENFLREQGPFDVVHFNNVEGLSTQALSTKKVFPNTTFILSLHDYYTVCPQLRLWRNEAESCLDSGDGKNCAVCKPFSPDTNSYLRLKRLFAILTKIKLINSRTETRLALGVTTYILPAFQSLFRSKPNSIAPESRDGAGNRRAEGFGTYLKQSANLVNSNMDYILAVSERTKALAVARGIDKSKVHVEYIGTKFSEFEPQQPPKIRANGLCIAYLGYPNIEKGFQFFLETLERCPDRLAGQISVVLAARNIDSRTRQRIDALRPKYRAIHTHDGYTHSSLPIILEPVHLGVIPVLWEDNLPQIAFEFVGHNVPIVTSDLGGAQEIGNNKEFIFRAGDHSDLLQKLQKLHRDYEALHKVFYLNMRTPPSNQTHVERLSNNYYRATE